MRIALSANKHGREIIYVLSLYFQYIGIKYPLLVNKIKLENLVQ